MPPHDVFQSPADSDLDSAINVPTQRRYAKKSPLTSLDRLPYRRSNASLSNLFASTTALPTSPAQSGTSTPVNDSGILSPAATTGLRSPSPPATSSPAAHRAAAGNGTEIRDLISRSYAPHVSVLASQDTDELVRHKGISGGLLELLRPFGEQIQGKVTIRDSNGASRSYEDFGIRFVGVKDGLETPRFNDRRSVDSSASQQKESHRVSVLEFKPARLRTGGDVPQIEELIDRHLTFAEEQSGPIEADYLVHTQQDPAVTDPRATSPFYLHYLRRLLSGLPMTPSETISHPVASVIAISSRSPSPIEELRSLFSSSNTGEHRLPQWVHNEFLRYYVLIHDEDYDDIAKSMALFDQMKRHFGLHCHLLRLRSTQCVPSDDGSVKLPHCEWISAAEELSEIVRRETNDDDEDPTPWLFESDIAALRAFVREMVTQSVVPSMERASATWNDQVASRRRGLSGRFMSLSKRFTTFGGRNSSIPSIGGATGSNYDSLQGFYKPDAPEALMRKLADYSMMLRDFRLAQSTYEILISDFKSDKAWRYYAGANEMAAISSLLVGGGSSKTRIEAVDQALETAYYSYITRVGAPYNALRTLILTLELLKSRGGNAVDDAARWATKILDDRLVGPMGHVLVMERVSACFTERPSRQPSTRDTRRKAAFWNALTADAWLRLEKAGQAEKRLFEATRLYNLSAEQGGEVRFDEMSTFLFALRKAVESNRAGPRHLSDEDLLLLEEEDECALVEPLQQHNEDINSQRLGHGHRKSMSTAGPPLPLPVQTAYNDSLVIVPSAFKGGNHAGFGGRRGSTFSTEMSGTVTGQAPLSPHPVDAQPVSPVVERRDPRADGFE